jgi:hypothetical protein
MTPRTLTARPLVLAWGAVVAAAAPARAQVAVLDEGTFRLAVGGREIGTETFTIRRVGQGPDAHVIANAVIELDLETGHEQVKPLLQTAPDMSVARYQLEISGRESTELAVTLQGRRFVARTRTPSGEQEREFRANPGTVLLEQGVAHQYWFLSQLPEGADVTVLVPRAGDQHRVVVRASRAESLELRGATVEARHATLEVDGAVHEVWYDPDGRVLKALVPGTGFSAERTSR